MAARHSSRPTIRSLKAQKPDEAFLSFTFSGDPEAYKDRFAWTGELTDQPHADFPTIDPAWAQQAGDVAAFKVNHLQMDDPSLPVYTNLQEQCRGVVKDMSTKVFGAMSGAAAFGDKAGQDIPINPDSRLASAPKDVQEHFKALYHVMDDFSHNQIGPIEADRKLLLLTGGKGIVEVPQQMSALLHGTVGEARRK